MERFRNGIITPTIIRQLRSILDQYPDDGQILKELIQNAEDAGAKEIKFLYDESHYGEESLVSASMAPFQGPALYAYNDAMFSEKDWDSVRMLQGSVKEKDPLKVGRFGLGFKSVYHMTDLPSIYSDALIGYLDPHARYVQKGEMTPCWHIGEDREEIHQFQDQFRPFQQELFGTSEKTFPGNQYPHTLFRFPLRTQKSDLSQIIYTKEKVESLFQSFEIEAHQVLLFLRHLEKVELYEKEQHGQPQLRFRVEITPESLKNCREERNNFLEQIKNKTSQMSQCSFKVTTKTTKFMDGLEVQSEMRSWVICHLYGCQDHQIRKISEELGYLPWVAVAICVDPVESQNPPRGHLFSFLPLPQEGMSPTGLPVHVHGYFALEQNRRHIKWPSADQNRNNLTDRSLLWNMYLVGTLLPAAMINLFQYLASHEFSPELVYSSIPNIEHVQYKWKDVLDQYFLKLFQGTVCHTTHRGGQWVMLKDALLEDSSIKTMIKNKVKILLTSPEVAKNVVALPEHLLEAMTRYKKSVNSITPAIVCQALHAIQMWHSFTHEEKLLLLDYITQDLNGKALLGLELLPLDDGTITTFSRQTSGTKVYIDSVDHPRSLLPGCYGHFTDNNVSSDMQNRLYKLASLGGTQLTCLKPEHLPDLLHSIFPLLWKENDVVQWSDTVDTVINEKWLQQIWQYLNRWFPNDLRKFEQFHLIHTGKTQSWIRFWESDRSVLVKLSGSLPLIFKSRAGRSLSETGSNALTKCRIQVLDNLPQHILQHQAIDKYILSPSPKGIQKALLAASDYLGVQGLQEIIKEQLSEQECKELRSLLGKDLSVMSEFKRVIQNLPIFETVGSTMHSKRHVSVMEIRNGIEGVTLPVHLPQEVLDLSNQQDRKLARSLGAILLNTTEQLEQLIFPVMQQSPGLIYTQEQMDTLMIHVLHNLRRYNCNSGNIVAQIKNLRFVPNSVGELGRPDERFDPLDQVLTELFLNQDSCPCGKYREREILHGLREVGLKSLSDIDAGTVLEIAIQLDQLQHQLSSDVQKRSVALLDLLKKRPELLNHWVGGDMLSKKLSCLSWVMPEEQRPSDYPKKLPWAGSPVGLKKPVHIRLMDIAYICGSISPVVQSKGTKILASAFEWDRRPEVKDVVVHMKHVIQAYSPEDKPLYMGIILKIYKNLSQAKAEELLFELKENQIEEWIWHGDGFVSPDAMVFQQPFADLRPHVYCIPQELRTFRNLLSNVGVIHECNLDQVLAKIQMFHQNYTDSDESISRDLQLAIDILNEVAKKCKSLSEEGRKNLLVPLHTENCLKMAPLEKCTYCEEEWLSNGASLSDMTDDCDEILPVHPNVPARTVDLLKIPALMSRVLDAEELDLGYSYGQSEPLTRRLKTILQDYTDGFAIPKELIQNADDAGATEVKFLYDERQNEDARTCLIDEGMERCQGPALWAFNNAVFNDSDFKNIVKLSGATKENQTSKIGRFGLGFNSVYHLTDVPSFISRNYVAIFDPHMTHLGKAVRGSSKPGIKLDMQRHRRRLTKLQNQFKPYNGIFGCDLSPQAKQTNYDGTLFRFPLRTYEEAQTSEIMRKYYNREEMLELLETFARSCESVLLFAQNVLEVKVYHLPADAVDPSTPVELFSVNRHALRFIRELVPHKSQLNKSSSLSAELTKFIQQSSILKEATEELLRKRESKGGKARVVESSYILKMTRTIKHSFTRLSPAMSEQCDEVVWLVGSSMGTERSFKIALERTNLLPVGGAAVKLKEWTPVVPDLLGNVDDPQGQTYSFLPLPIPASVPLHVNGYFAMTSNRRYLCEKTTDDKVEPRAEWNAALMEDAVCRAYIMVLEDLRLLTEPHRFQFMQLWPQNVPHGILQKTLYNSFYTMILKGKDPPTLFSDGKQWKSFENVIFLDPDFRACPIGDTALEVLRMLLAGTEKIVVDLPPTVHNRIVNAGFEKVLQTNSCDERCFFTILLSKLDDVPHGKVDVLMKYALLCENENLDHLLKDAACIPVAPSGKVYEKPSNLVHPKGKAAKLYQVTDQRFPVGSLSKKGGNIYAIDRMDYTERRLMSALLRLGMVEDSISWKEITKRAQFAQSIENSEEALKYAEHLVTYLEWRLKQDTSQERLQAKEEMKGIPFLPIKPKPTKFPFPWKGDSYHHGCMLSPADLYMEKDWRLVCCWAPVADPRVLGSRHTCTQEFLEMNQKLTITQAVSQLEFVMDVMPDTLSDPTKCNILHSLVDDLYQFFEDSCREKSSTDQISNLLRKKKCLLVDRIFMDAEKCALNTTDRGSPYLCAIPENFKRKYPKFLEAIGVKKEMGCDDYVHALGTMKEEFKNTALKSTKLEVAVHFVQSLCESLEKSKTVVEELPTEVFLPDTRGILMPRKDLCFNNCQWMKPDKDQHFTHETIAPKVISLLKIQTIREEELGRYSSGLPFGQSEKLTHRLRRIMDSYPCDKEILKELVQNADDAGATEIHFVKDARHHPDKCIFEEKWKPLQGPALCIYNNKPFTEKDLMGIQNLGEGSKGDDPSKTGQYGVGFNCVYHLTDTPTFLTSGSEIGQVLCAFDPHCRYVPGANPNAPGRMFKEIEHLKKKFPDVFSGYLEDDFSSQVGTMFRLPLRTKDQASKCELGGREITVQDLQDLLDKFVLEAKDMLLFLSHIEKICIWEVEHGKNLTCVYSVECNIDEESKQKRNKFDKLIKAKSKELKSATSPVINIEETNVLYTLVTSDSNHVEEKWVISQRLGISEGAQFPSSVSHAIKHGDLALLPRGGVAAKLKSSSKTTQIHSHVDKYKSRLYCFLPLPIKTELPVHVNGHFVLDNESRRYLWKDEDGGYRTEWNKMIMTEVVSPAYLTLLLWMKDNMNPTKNQIHKYYRFFPDVFQEVPYLGMMSKSLYKAIESNKSPLMAALAPDQNNLEWYPLCGSGQKNVFFNNLHLQMKTDLPSMNFLPTKPKPEPHESLTNILHRVGFKLLCCPLWLYHCFQNSGVAVDHVSPKDVLDFMHSSEAIQHVGQLPLHICKTPFHNFSTYKILWEYCSRVPNYTKQLEGCPMLLAADEKLYMVDRTMPKYMTMYSDLLPSCGKEFAHSFLFQKLGYGKQCFELQIFREFGINEFAELLPRYMPQLQETTSIKWVTDRSPVKEPWIFHLWSFLTEIAQRSVNGDLIPSDDYQWQKLLTLLEPLNEWCILPANRGKEMFLVPLGKATTVMDLTFNSAWGHQRYATSGILDEILRKIQILEPTYAVVSGSKFLSSSGVTNKNTALVRFLVGNSGRPDTILAAIQESMLTKNLKNMLSKTEGEKLLKYFSDSLETHEKAISGVPQGITTLLNLPFYMTVKKKQISLGTSGTYIVPEDTPAHDLDIFHSTKGNVFLYSNHKLNRLYEFLGCMKKTTPELYGEFIFQQDHFNMMTPDGRMVHLDYIRYWCKRNMEKIESLRRRREPNSDLEREVRAMLGYLQELRFVTDSNGDLRTANSFMDPRNPVFKAMNPENCFPSKPFNDVGWIEFLKNLGLQHQITEEMFVIYAIQVEAEAEDFPDKASASSEVLLDHLKARSDLNESNLLENILDIRFLAPSSIEVELLHLCPAYEQKGNLPFHCFRGSVVNVVDNRSLCWTQARLISLSSLPTRMTCTEDNNRILERLQVQQHPSVHMVVQHMKKLCHHQERFQIKTGQVNPQIAKSLLAVLNVIFRFFAANKDNKDISQENLGGVPCVLEDSGPRLVCPNQLVVKLQEGESINNYLYNVPVRFFEHVEVLCQIGATDEPTIKQYSDILSSIYKNIGDQKMNPNEEEAVKKSVQGMFSKVHDAADAKDLHILYLPSQDGKLQISSDLIFADNGEFQNRLQGQHCGMSLLDSRMCEKEHMILETVIDKLPKCVQPTWLSSLATEKLEEEGMNEEQSEISEHLQIRFSSELFIKGLERLLKHIFLESLSHSGSENNIEERIEKMKTNMNKIQIRGASKIITYLEYQGEKVDGSEQEEDCFCHRTTGEDWTMYISKPSNCFAIWTSIAKFLNQINANLFQENIQELMPILQCPVEEINNTLDKLKIRCDLSQNDLHPGIKPELGSYIPVEDHHQLQQDFHHFDKGEYVGYEVEDDPMAGAPAIVYARIVQEVGNCAQPLYAKIYEVQIDPIGTIKKISARDLYKFHRKTTLTAEVTALVEAEDSGQYAEVQENKYADIEKVKHKITEILESSENLSEEELRKVQKRLFLLWHPDKNIGHEKFATEVFQHLQNELFRLERNCGTRSSDGNCSYSSSSTNNFWNGPRGEDFMDYMNSRARSHGQQRQRFKENFARSNKHQGQFYHGVPPSFSDRNPQPSQARKWLRQAYANLRSVPADQEQHSYEWVCCKILQAGEVALTGARYALGIQTSSKNLSLRELASGLGSDTMTNLAMRMESVIQVKDSSHMCHPNPGDPIIPHEKYSSLQADQALEIARQLVACAKEFIQTRWQNVGDLP